MSAPSRRACRTPAPAESKRWTAAEVRRLQDESRPWPRYELIAGQLLVTSAPTLQHQRIVGRLLWQLAQYLEREPVGEVLLSPADLTLRDETVSQPDVFVVPREIAASAHQWPDVVRIVLAIKSHRHLRCEMIAD